MNEVHFLEVALSDAAGAWRQPHVNSLAALHTPDLIFGSQKTLLRSDIHEVWARWFIESFFDVRRTHLSTFNYPQVFGEVLEGVQKRFRDLTKPQQLEIASAIAKLVFLALQAQERAAARGTASADERRLLLDMAGHPPRCWICRRRFTPEAVEGFLNRARVSPTPPQYLDILKPQGLSSSDLRIEIDHVVAHSHGGGEAGNLALACGWCNRHKNAYRSIYDLEASPRRSGNSEIGMDSLPQPFWSVRIMAVKSCCESPDGCPHDPKHTELTVAPVVQGGAPNPANLGVFCYEHDPLREIRFKPRADVARIWFGDA